MLAVVCLFLAPFLVDLEDLVRQNGLTWESDAPTGREEIKSEKGSVVFSPGFGVAVVNGLPRDLSSAPVIRAGKVSVPPDLAAEIKKLAVAPESEVRKPDPIASVGNFPSFSVVIDPGHGGMHTGCKGRTGLTEKDINLDVGMRLRGILEAGGARVTMTRTTDRHFAKDVHEDLQHRVDISNRVRPDVFVSIHVNYVDRSDPRGFEVWVPQNAAGRRDRESRRLAKLIRREYGRAIGSDDRGTKDERNLYVLRLTKAPAVLLEMEFISNRAAERLLATDSFRQKVAEATARALRSYAVSR